MSVAGRGGRDRVYRLVIGFGLGLFRVCGWTVSAEGAEHIPAEGPAVLAITHFGYLDFALVESVIWRRRRRLTRFLTVAAAFDHPVSGPLMRAMNHVPVVRGDGEAAYADGLRALRRGELVGVFPEGGVHRSYTVGRCKTGAVRLAAEAGVPLIPIAVWGGQRILTRGHKSSLRSKLRVPVVIRIGVPFAVRRGVFVAQSRQLRARLTELVAAAQSEYPVVSTPASAGAGDRPWWLPAHLGGSAPTPAESARMDAADQARRAERRLWKSAELAGSESVATPDPTQTPEAQTVR